MYTLHARSCTFGADLYAKSVLINKISALELSRKLINSALVVGLFFFPDAIKKTLAIPIKCTEPKRADIPKIRDELFSFPRFFEGGESLTKILENFCFE